MWKESSWTEIGPGDIYSHDPEDHEEGWLCLTKINDLIICLPVYEGEWAGTMFTQADSDSFYVWEGKGMPYG